MMWVSDHMQENIFREDLEWDSGSYDDTNKKKSLTQAFEMVI